MSAIYQSSFATIKQFLTNTFPTITNIYFNNLPAGFARPSFFVELLRGTSEDLNRDKYHNKIIWQIVYYAPLDQDGNVNVLEQLSITEQLQQKLMEAMMLTAPDGTQYQILSLEVESRDKQLYCTIGLGALSTRPQAQYDLMQIINNDFKEG